MVPNSGGSFCGEIKKRPTWSEEGKSLFGCHPLRVNVSAGDFPRIHGGLGEHCQGAR